MKPRLRTLPTISLILISFLLFACEQTQVAAPEPVTITIAGATSMRPVLQALSAEYSRRHPSVLFDLRGGGSTIGEEQLAAGLIDLAASTLSPPATLPPPEAESNQTISAEQKLFRVPIGIDGLAIIVHRSNTVAALSVAQVRDLFSGKFVRWSAVGGEDRDVLLVSREDGSGSRQLFESHLMGVDAVSLTAIVMPTSADVVDYVAKNPQAIAYVSRAYLVDQLDQVQPDAESPSTSLSNQVKVVALEGKLPTLNNLTDSSYLLSAPIYLVGNGQPQGTIRQFVEFILGPVGQGIVGHYHARIR